MVTKNVMPELSIEKILQLIKKKKRIVIFEENSWIPCQIVNPYTKDFFTNGEAWLYIVKILQSKYTIEHLISCDEPFTIITNEIPRIYIQILVNNDYVFGKNFCYF